MVNISYSLFFKANLFFSSILFLFFLQYNQNYNGSELLLLILASFSSAAILYVLLYILLFIFTWTKTFILYFSAVVFVVVDIGLIVDFFIFRLYKFHINAMVLNILTSPDAADSIQIGILPVLLFVVLLSAFIRFEFYLIKKLLKTPEKSKYDLNKKVNKFVMIPLFLIILGEKVSYGFLSLLSYNETIAKFKVIPLYQPLTVNKFAAKHFGIKPEVQTQNTIQKDASLNYPLSPLKLQKDPKKINIFIFASDSVCDTCVTDKITPNIEKFKQDAIVFENHYSGGNATRFGIFSLIYGLNSTYWFSFLNANRGPVLFDVLNQLGYKIDIISSANTNWPEFRETCYFNVQKSIKDEFKGKPWEKDRQSSKYLLERIEKCTQEKPLFSFIFLDAPHGYSSPKSFNPFRASEENINYLTVSKDGEDIKTVFAQYKNAVSYNDTLFGEMIEKLKEKGMYDEALIIYTSDHGQEFYEYGSFGHNSSFSRAQIVTPMIIKLPNSLKNKIDLPSEFPDILTSHNDVVPTLLTLLGLENKSSDYSNGKNIFDKAFGREYVFSANWNNNAIIDKEFTYIFSNLPNKMFKNEIRANSNYAPVKNGKMDSKKVLEILNENRKFLK